MSKTKTHRQNAAALDRQEQPDMVRLIETYKSGKDIAKLLSSDADLRRSIQIHGSCEEAVIQHIQANYEVAKKSTKAKAHKE